MRAFGRHFRDIRPAVTLVEIARLARPTQLIEIEAEAIVGAAASRRDYYTANKREKARGYARAVAVGDVVHVSGCTSADPAGAVRAPGRRGGVFRYLPRGH